MNCNWGRGIHIGHCYDCAHTAALPQLQSLPLLLLISEWSGLLPPRRRRRRRRRLLLRSRPWSPSTVSHSNEKFRVVWRVFQHFHIFQRTFVGTNVQQVGHVLSDCVWSRVSGLWSIAIAVSGSRSRSGSCSCCCFQFMLYLSAFYLPCLASECYKHVVAGS